MYTADDLDNFCYHADRDHQKSLLNRLSVKELRVLLIHYKLASDKREAAEWPKGDMVEEIATVMADEMQ